MDRLFLCFESFCTQNSVKLIQARVCALRIMKRAIENNAIYIYQLTTHLYRIIFYAKKCKTNAGARVRNKHIKMRSWESSYIPISIDYIYVLNYFSCRIT